ncbi:MAG: surface carbohydrate biosynthesis protein [Desulfobacteraceae bacterium]|nr:surface carbohydrate biosynthesis protein [Desulfobacteraceae bacterium]
MATSKTTLLIPVESQARELDPKLLLACVAARRGFASIIGPRREMHFHIPSFPRSIYLSKSTTKGSRGVFRTLRRLGHQIVAWDEEALVHLPPETYYRHRLSPISLGYVSHLLAWGEDNAELWRQYPEFPSERPLKITITGNPRGDLLRPEIRVYYDSERKKICERYGDFILINTNFGLVNAFHADMNLIPPAPPDDSAGGLGRKVISLGLNRESAEELHNHKYAIFEDFQQLIPELEKAFPGYNIIVRPHPSENPQIYHNIAAKCKRVEVTNEGNVVPWLLAAKALIHNGCTTGVEAFAVDTPAISYRATVNERFDEAFHHLANQLSHQCFEFAALRKTLSNILSNNIDTAHVDQRKTLINRYLAAQDGPLACERMVDIFEEMTQNSFDSSMPGIKHRLQSWYWATRRRFKKRIRGYRANLSHNRPDYLRHRYPEISLQEVYSRLNHFQLVLGDHTELKVEKIFNQFYRISAG